MISPDNGSAIFLARGKKFYCCFVVLTGEKEKRLKIITFSPELQLLPFWGVGQLQSFNPAKICYCTPTVSYLYFLVLSGCRYLDFAAC